MICVSNIGSDENWYRNTDRISSADKKTTAAQINVRPWMKEWNSGLTDNLAALQLVRYDLPEHRKPSQTTYDKKQTQAEYGTLAAVLDLKGLHCKSSPETNTGCIYEVVDK